MFGKWFWVLVGLLLGLVLMPWPWFLVPAILGFLLGHVLQNYMHPTEIPSETPKTARELLDEPPPPPRPPLQNKINKLSARKLPALPPPPPPPENTPSEKELRESRLARLFCPIFTQIAIADGPINQQEIRHIRLYFEEELAFSTWGLSAVRAELKAWLKKTTEISELLSKARPEIPPAMRLNFVSALYELALVDGELQRAERDLLQRVVRYLNLSDEQLQSVTSAFFGDGSEHYAALNLEPQASDEEIKAAYRRLAVAYHPDSHVQKSPQHIQKVTETFHRIKEAYEALKKIRGF